MISKRDIGKTAGNLNAILVDYRDLMTEAELEKLRAARKTLIEIMRKA